MPKKKSKDERLDERWFAWCLSEWRGMPEFVQRHLLPWKSVKVNFRSQTELRAFADLMGQDITEHTQYVWFPAEEEFDVVGKMRYVALEEDQE